MSFIEEIAPHARKAAAESDVLASLILAQAVLESAWGTSELAQKGKNLFGIKGEYKGQSVMIITSEFVNGKEIKVNAAFRKYPSWLESIRDLTDKYVNGVSWNKDLYRAVVGEKDYRKAAWAVKNAGYATDPKYAEKLIGVIETNNLTKYDVNTKGVDLDLRIAIDAGHGNNTPGKRAPDDSMREFHFNSVVAKYVVEELRTYQGVLVEITHDPSGIRDIPLKERTDKANRWGADAFVSIHANAVGSAWSNANGIETYVYTSKPAGAVALATKVQAALIASTGLRDRGVKVANFHVLRETKMDAILVECGFMDNPAELALLKSDSYRRKCAQAIVSGLAKQFGLKKKSGVVAPTVPKEESSVDKNKPSAWAKKDWDEAVANGYFDGTRPQDNITREEMAVVVNRLRNNLLPLIYKK